MSKKSAPAARAPGRAATTPGRTAIARTGTGFGLEEAALAILFLSVAFVFSTGLASQFILAKLFALRISTLLLVILWVYRLRQGRLRFPPRVVSYPLFALFAWWVFSTFFALHKPTALSGVHDGYKGLWTHINYLILFVTCSTLPIDEGKLKRILGILVCTFIPVALYAIAQCYGMDFMAWRGVVRNGGSTIGNPTVTATLLSLCFPFALFFAISAARPFERILWAVAAFILLSAVVATLSRAPLVGSLLSAVIMVGALLLQKGMDRKKALIVAALFLLGLSVILATNWRSVVQVGERFRAIISLKDELATTDRGYWYRGAALSIRDYPWFGVGFDGFRLTYPRYRLEAEGRLAQTKDMTPTKVHNMYLQVAVESGIPGLLLYLLLIAAVLSLLLRRPSPNNAGAPPLLKAAFLAAIVSYLAEDLTGWPEISHAAYFWAILGLAVAAAVPFEVPKPAAQPHPSTRRAALAGASITIIFLVLLCADTARTMVVDRLFWQSLSMDVKRQWPRIESNIQSGLELAGSDYHYYDVAGQIYSARFAETGDLKAHEAAATVLDEAERANPFDAYVLLHQINLESAELAHGRASEPDADAEEAVRQVLAMDPNNDTVHMVLAVYYKQQNKLDQALSSARRAKEMRPGDFSHYLLEAEILEAAGGFAASERTYRARVHALEARGDREEEWETAKLTLALILSQQGRFAEALKEAEDVLKEDPNNAIALLIVGGAYGSLGDIAKARSAFERILVYAPEDQYALQGMEQLRSMSRRR